MRIDLQQRLAIVDGSGRPLADFVTQWNATQRRFLSYQPLDADLATIAAQANTAYGLGLLTLADEAALRRMPVRVLTSGASTALTTADFLLVVRKTVGSATGVTMPASPASGDAYAVKDGKGDAAANPITITPAAGNIDGAATYVINANRGVARMTYDGSEWVLT